MLLEYVPQYRDETEAASARFPGDAPAPAATGVTRTLLSVAAAVAMTIVLLSTSTRGGASATLWGVLAQADKIDHPVFVAGVVLAAIGAAMIVVPLAYLTAQRHSSRPVVEAAVRVDLAGDLLTLRLPLKELAVEWEGVVAVAETRNLFVLKTLGDLRIVLPKRGAPGFADEPSAAAETLRELLRRRVTPLADLAAAPSPAPAPQRRVAA